MDWLENSISVFKNKIKRQSLKKTLSLYICISIIVVLTLYILTVVFCQGWIELVYTKYSIDLDNGIPINIIIDLKLLDKIILYSANFVKTFSVSIYSVIAIIITSNLFYKSKIQVPVEILKEGAKNISCNNLDFSFIYNNNDEFSDICEAFDKMRLQIIKNNKSNWDLINAQKQLNSAFAHDIKTPLTVIQGYTEFLAKYYKEGKITENKLLSTLDLIQSQIIRLHNFSDKMKDIQDINSFEIKQKITEFKSLNDKIEDIVNGLKNKTKININIVNKIKKHSGYFDENTILQVIDNLLSNAISFSKSSIEIILDFEYEFLYIYVKDDGIGFSKDDISNALKPYYSSRKNNTTHFGIGLSICSVLCEKHGGKLTLNNSIYGGAIVCATFLVVVDKK